MAAVVVVVVVRWCLGKRGEAPRCSIGAPQGGAETIGGGGVAFSGPSLDGAEGEVIPQCPCGSRH